MIRFLFLLLISAGLPFPALTSAGHREEPVHTAAVLETPMGGTYQSGIGVVRGWACGAWYANNLPNIEIVLRRYDPNVAVSEQQHLSTIRAQYGTPRADTQRFCSREETGRSGTDSGFVALVNWNQVVAGLPSSDDGTYLIDAELRINGHPLLGNIFTVVTLGQEFVRGVERDVTVDNFPFEGESVTLIWDQSRQNFSIKAWD